MYPYDITDVVRVGQEGVKQETSIPWSCTDLNLIGPTCRLVMSALEQWGASIMTTSVFSFDPSL